MQFRLISSASLIVATFVAGRKPCLDAASEVAQRNWYKLCHLCFRVCSF